MRGSRSSSRSWRRWPSKARTGNSMKTVVVILVLGRRAVCLEMGGTRSNRLPLRTAEGPRVSLAAGAVQARPGPARPAGAVEISRTSATASGFLNCESGVRVTPGGTNSFKNLRLDALVADGVWLRLGCGQLPSGLLECIRESFDVVSVGSRDE